MATTNENVAYNCMTQRDMEPTFGLPPVSHNDKDGEDLPSVVLGYGSIIPRWRVPAAAGPLELLYFVVEQTFPSASDAVYAGQELQKAADEWNVVNFGVRITQTSDRSKANINVEYQKECLDRQGVVVLGVLAISFFPHENCGDLIVYEYGMTGGLEKVLKNTFLHELGHVLGLRHEFGLMEGHGAVQFMGANPESIMSYKQDYIKTPITIQKLDIDGIQGLHALKEGDMHLGSPVTDSDPRLRN